MTNGPVCIDERQKKGATTANINCYVNRSNTNQKTLILDCDGEKGSAFPLLHYARRSFQHLSRTKEEANDLRVYFSGITCTRNRYVDRTLVRTQNCCL